MSKVETIVQSRLLPALMFIEVESHRTLVPYLPNWPALYARQQAVMKKSEQNGLPVRYLGTMPLFAGFRVYNGQRYDWVLVNAAEDPLFKDRDGFPVPGRILDELHRIQRSKLDFDVLYVAHEVPRGAVCEGAPLTTEMLMPPPPKAVQRLSDRLGAVGRALWAVAALPVIASGTISGLITAGAATVVGLIGLDPIMLGTVVGLDRPVAPGEPAAWFYLGHWSFNREA